MPGHCHKLVAKIAREAAGEHYELLMQVNPLFDSWKAQNPGLGPKALEARFVATKWGLYVEFARATLAHMLTRPDIDEGLKEDIMEALVLDATLRRGRKAGARVLGEIARRAG